MMKPDESPYLSFRSRRRGRGICFFFSPQKQIPRRSAPRNDRGGLIFDGVEEGAFAT